MQFYTAKFNGKGTDEYIREFKNLLRQRRRQRRLKIEFSFYLRIPGYSFKSLTLFNTVKAMAKLNLGHRNKFEKEF